MTHFTPTRLAARLPMSGNRSPNVLVYASFRSPREFRGPDRYAASAVRPSHEYCVLRAPSRRTELARGQLIIPDCG